MTEPPNAPPPPPPAPAPAAAPAEIEPYRSPRALSRKLLILLGITLALDLIAVASGLSERSLLDRAQRGGVVTFDEAESNDNRQMVIGLGQAAVFVVTVIVFIVWFRRAYRNLPALGARRLKFKPGWAVGAWFVPILNLFRPVQIASDIWAASDPALPDTPDTPWQTQKVSPLIGFWWASWLIANFTGRATFTLNEGQTLDALQSTNTGWLVADVTSAIASAFAIAVVWKITQRQEERARKVAVAGTLVGTP